jgi:hypothetical protein
MTEGKTKEAHFSSLLRFASFLASGWSYRWGSAWVDPIRQRRERRGTRRRERRVWLDIVESIVGWVGGIEGRRLDWTQEY